MSDASRSTQTVVLSPFAGNPGARSTQLAVMAPHDGEPSARATHVSALAVYGPPASRRVMASQIHASVSHAADVKTTLPRISQIFIQVAYTRNVPENNRVRSFTFKFDGHVFYGITLGEKGTFLYDTTTGQWTRFQTGDFNIWNFQYPAQWKDRTIGFDYINPSIYYLDPSSNLDDSFRTIKRRATGVVEHRGFSRVPQYSLTFLGSLGEDETDGNTVSLSYSDDGGKTYSDPKTIVVEPGAYQQRLSFRSLGSIKQPGRFFILEDEGGMMRIDAIEAEIGDQD